MLKLNEHAADSLQRAQPVTPVAVKSSPAPARDLSADPQPPFRLRILHVLNRLDTGGTEHAVMNVVSGLDPDLFEHIFCVTRGFNPENAMVQRLARPPHVAGRPGGSGQFLVPSLVRIMKRCRPHIVHSRNWGSIEAVVAARLAHIPIAIHSEHGYELDMMKGLPARQRLFRRAVYSMADAVFTVTEELRHFHAAQASIAAEKLRVLRNGVDTVRFAPRPESRKAARQKLGLAPDSLVIGSVGRMVPIKDYPTLLAASAKTAAAHPNIRVLLAGSGPELHLLKQQAASTPELAGRVLFVGAADNIPELLNAMDIFVLPSILEGMSNTILEAMASGLPILATRVGGNPELVVDTSCGWLFHPGDVAGLAARLTQLAENPALRCQFGCEARKRVEARFSLREMIRNYRSLYFELAEKRELIGARDN